MRKLLNDIITSTHKAWILPYTMLILSLLALIISSETGIGTQSYSKARNLARRHQAMAYCTSGINVLLLDSDSALRIDGRSVQLGPWSLRINKQPWGLFEILKSTVTIGNDSLSLIILAAPCVSPDTVLVIGHQDGPMAYTGQIQLQGHLRLRHPDLKAASFVGSSSLQFTGKADTNSHESGKVRMYYDFTGLAEWLLSESSTGIFDFNLAPKQLDLPFEVGARVFYSSDDLTLRDLKFRGKIIIASASRIEVQKSSELDHCILIAPVIRIHSGSASRIQAIARDSIIVEAGALLQYPSVLLLASDSQAVLQPAIVMKQKSTVEGLVIISPDSNGYNQFEHLMMEEGALIRGHLIANTQLPSEIRIQGRVTCYALMSQIKGRLYQDMLHNTSIERLEQWSIILPRQNEYWLSPIYTLSSNLRFK
jgi:hypothetical protein